MENSARDYYAILGVSRDADPDVIRAAFRALAKKYHPDVNSTVSSARFRDLNEAHSVLADPAKRAAYDSLFWSAEPQVASAPERENEKPERARKPSAVEKAQRVAASVGMALLAITLIFGLIVMLLVKLA
jgi:curved DNA-binding protein